MTDVICIYKVPLRNGVDLPSPGVSQVETRNHRRSNDKYGVVRLLLFKAAYTWYEV